MEIAVKTIALFFLTQALLVYIAAAAAGKLSRNVSYAHRAKFVFLSLTGPLVVSALFAGLMVFSAKEDLIAMATPYFYKLMHGGAEKAILFSGILGLLLSVLASYLFVRAGKLPGLGGLRLASRFCKIRVFVSPDTNGAALVGAINPIIVVSAGFSQNERELALFHEYMHYSLRHNWMKLALRAILRLNMFNLPLHRIINGFGEMCEYACDAACAKAKGAEYVAFIKDKGLLIGADGEIRNRLKALCTDVANEVSGAKRRRLFLAFSYSAAAAAVLIPLAAAVISSVSRCAVVCFLGF